MVVVHPAGIGLVIRHESDDHLAEILRHVFQLHEAVVADGLGGAGIADAVNASQILGLYEDILRALRVIGQLARNGAGVFSRILQGHQCPVAHELTGLTSNAAHQIAAGHMALGPVVGNLLPALAHNAAHIAGIRAIHRAVALAAYNGAQGGLTHNAAGALLFGRDGAPVLALVHQRPGTEGEVQGAVPLDGQVVLRVFVVFPGQRTYNAAGVDVGVYCAVVDAAANLTGGICLQVLPGHILHNIFVFLPAAHDVDHPAHLICQRLQIADDLSAVVCGTLAHGADLPDQIVHPVSHRAGGSPDGVLVVHIDVRQLNIVPGLPVRIGTIHGGIVSDDLQHIVDSIQHIIQRGLHLDQAVLNGTVGIPRIVGRPAQNTLGRIELLFQLLQGVLIVDQHVVGLHLAQHAAALLSGVHVAIVHAVRHEAAAGARHAADIVARVLIANIALIPAQPDHAAAGAHHTADVGAADAAFIAGKSGHRNVLNGQGFRSQLRVHIGLVHAVVHDARILAHNAAQNLAAPDVALHGALFHSAADLVQAHNAANLADAADSTEKADVFNGSGVDACKTAHLGGASGRGHPADDLQIFDRGSLLDVAEQAPGRAVLIHDQAVKLVVLPVKDTAKGGDLEILHVLQVNIRIQDHLQIFAGAVQTAELCKLFQVLRRGHRVLFINRLPGVLFRRILLCPGTQWQEHGGNQQQCKDAHNILFHCFVAPSSKAG